MTPLIVKKDKGYAYVEYKGVELTYEVTREEKYGEYDFFDMNPAALCGPTIICYKYKIGDLEITREEDRTGPPTAEPEFFARDCEDGKSFEIIAKYPHAEYVLGTVNIEPTLG